MLRFNRNTAVRSPVFFQSTEACSISLWAAALQQTDIQAHSSYPGARRFDHLPGCSLHFCWVHGSSTTVVLGYPADENFGAANIFIAHPERMTW
jgi:hypothetical protein